MNIKKRQIIGINLYVYDNTTVSFSWRGVGIAHVPLAASMFMTNIMLLGWTSDSVLLPT